jgi:hypothetical protein
MPHGQSNPQDSGDTTRNGINIAMLIIRAWATSLEVFLHKGMGRRYNGIQAALVLLLVPFYSLAWPHDDLRPLLWFLLAFLVMCGVTRIGSLLRRGQPCHSFYTGWPRLMGRTRKLSEVTFKRYIEPILVLAIGFALRENVNPPLGTYLMIGAGCLFLSVSVSVIEEQVRAEDMNDAVIEQSMVAERFRGMRGHE